ncbi:hypothetical protein CYMTET_42943 [Cymbomonas tetramitiformis]|uniref:ENTH domain-containing protein n=1 Tax=Cymbomonas tetramitiformis TaxID=36881 RepID=A0AAE0C315_9CHLO|nr:hypothetical protein CYMTET_45794 [Cymbomonas tetramitiformis]KAK3247561.1 hypothetical protein CYMTET_42943 [Cymbomonas tetramitiformis]|eukprot:gene17991-21427_t
MEKAFSGAFKSIKNTVLNVPAAEVKVLEATNNDPWGPHGTTMSEIAQLTRNHDECAIVLSALWKRLDSEGKSWRNVYKALAVFEFLIGHGSERVLRSLRDRSYELKTLEDFQYIEPSGKDQGINVRHKAATLRKTLDDSTKIAEMRDKAIINKNKYGGLSSSDARNGGGFTVPRQTGSIASNGFGSTDFSSNRSFSPPSRDNNTSAPPPASYGNADDDDDDWGPEASNDNSGYVPKIVLSAAAPGAGKAPVPKLGAPGTKPVQRSAPQAKPASAPPAKAAVAPANTTSLDFDFDPRGSSTVKAAAPTPSPQVDFFASAAAPAPASAVDLFATTSTPAAAPAPVAVTDPFAVSNTFSAAPPQSTPAAASAPTDFFATAQAPQPAQDFQPFVAASAVPPPQTNPVAFGDFSAPVSSVASQFNPASVSSQPLPDMFSGSGLGAPDPINGYGMAPGQAPMMGAGGQAPMMGAGGQAPMMGVGGAQAFSMGGAGNPPQGPYGQSAAFRGAPMGQVGGANGLSTGFSSNTSGAAPMQRVAAKDVQKAMSGNLSDMLATGVLDLNLGSAPPSNNPVQPGPSMKPQTQSFF